VLIQDADNFYVYIALGMDKLMSMEHDRIKPTN